MSQEKNNLMLSGHKLLYHLDELNKWHRDEIFPPIWVEVGPTTACNHRCKHCYISYLKEKAVTMPKEALLGLMRDLGAYGVKSICLAGRGEPMIHKNILEAIEVGKAAGLDIALATNGIYFDQEKAQRVLHHLTWVRFSILGGSGASYSLLQGAPKKDWQKLLNNVEQSVRVKKENSIDTTLGVVYYIFKENGHEVLETAKKFRDIGVDYFVVKTAANYEKNEYEADDELDVKYNELLKECEALSDTKFNCTVRWDMFREPEQRQYGECQSLSFTAVVDSDGGVFPCGAYWQDPRYCYGNVNEQSFSEVWKGEKREKIMKAMVKDVNFHECYKLCRNNTMNKFLWSLKHEPAHVNFI